MGLDQRLPSIAAMEKVARRRMPRFSWDFLQGGIGAEVALQRNRQALDAIEFSPRHLTSSTQEPAIKTHILDKTYAAPFGVAPVGLTGLVWPKALSVIASEAVAHSLPFGVSSAATESLSDLGQAAGPNMWFQLYGCKDPKIEQDLMDNAWASGARIMILTIDILGDTRREREISNGLSIPPKIGVKNLWQAAICPAWSFATLRHGLPQFKMLEAYMKDARGLGQVATAMNALRDFKITPARLADIRARWQGKLIVKGVLDPEDAMSCMENGADGIVVSNHGGRQLDAALGVPDALRRIRAAVGPDVLLIADSGVRSGLDIARMLACGANFVLLGRAIYYAIAAAGAAGVDHVLTILKLELMQTLRQVGCVDIAQLNERLARV